MDTSETRSLELQFRKQLALPVLTGKEIKGEGRTPFEVALVDPFTNKVVDSEPEASTEVEIVALKGDFGDVQAGNWTSEEFNENIVSEREDILAKREERRERNRKWPILGGNMQLKLNKGRCCFTNIKFRQYESWLKISKFKLGARISGTLRGMKIKEAVSESFTVKDHRNTLYKKHHPPSLSDEVWRLEKIGKDGAFHRRLSKERVKTVKDFLTLYFVDPTRLRNILGTGMSAKMCEVTVDHARTCVLDKELHFYYPSGSQHKKGVVFNVVGEVMGFVSDCQYITNDKLSETEKACARELVAAAYRHWADVVSVDNEASLMDGSLFLSTIEYSNPTMFATSNSSKVLNSHKNGKCDYLEPSTSSSDIMPSIYSLGGLTSLDHYGLPTMDSMDVRLDHPLSIPGHVANNWISDTDSMTQAFFEDEHLQFFDLDCTLQSSTLGSSTEFQTAGSGFLVPLPVDKAQRKWKMLFSVFRWFSIRRTVANKSSVKEVKRYH